MKLILKKALVTSFAVMALVVSPFAASSALASGGTGGGGGGTKPALAADFPVTAVPLPAGKLAAATGISPHWGQDIIVSLGLHETDAYVISLYTSAGFTEPAGEFSAYHFTSPDGAYRVTYTGANHDHSGTQTDAIVLVDKL